MIYNTRNRSNDTTERKKDLLNAHFFSTVNQKHGLNKMGSLKNLAML